MKGQKKLIEALSGLLGLSLLLWLGGCGGGTGDWLEGTGDDSALGGDQFTGTGTLTGTVDLGSITRAASGEVIVQIEGTDLQTTPDAEGNFRFDRVPVGEHTVAAFAEGRNLGAVVTAQVMAGEVTHAGMLRLEPAGQIAGLVRGQRGEGEPIPLARTRIIARPVVEEETPAVPETAVRHALRLARTDRTGSFVLRGVRPGTYAVTAEHEGYETGQITVEVEVGRTTPADFLLSAAGQADEGMVGGLVVGKFPGGSTRPLQGVRVQLLSPEAASTAEAELSAPDVDPTALPPRKGELVGYTNSRGIYKIRGVPAGEYVALAVKRGFRPERQAIEVKAGELTRVDFTLEALVVTVYGTVTAANPDGTAGEPLAGVRIIALEGPLTIEAMHGLKVLLPAERQVHPQPMERPQGHEDQRPAGPIFVEPQQHRPGDLALRPRYTTKTDENGTYRLLLPVGDYLLLAVKEGYERGVQRLHLTSDESEHEANFVLSPKEEPNVGAVAGVIKGIKYDGEEVLLARALVVLLPWAEAEEVWEAVAEGPTDAPNPSTLPSRPRWYAWTDEEGKYAIRNVPEGEYLGIALKQHFVPAKQRLKVVAGEVTRADFTLMFDFLKFAGHGSLVAVGRGQAILDGDGLFIARTVKGPAELRVRSEDPNLILRVYGFGSREELPDGTLVYTGEGTAFVQGRGLHLELKNVGLEPPTSEEAKIQLFARGEGQAQLAGEGWYRVHGGEGPWTPEGVTVNFAEPIAARPQ